MTRQLVQAGSKGGVSYSVEDKEDSVRAVISAHGKQTTRTYRNWQEAVQWVHEEVEEASGNETKRNHSRLQ